MDIYILKLIPETSMFTLVKYGSSLSMQNIDKYSWPFLSI